MSAGALDAKAKMDAIYRRQRVVYDVTRRYYLIGRDRLLADLHPPAHGAILEIGCGTGRNLIRAASLYRNASLHGLDLSPVMLETARGKIARSGLQARIALAEGDASNFDPRSLFGRAQFDRVVLSYTLSMIPPWQGALASALRAVVPGGSLHVVDFGTQHGHPAWMRHALRRWLSWFSVHPRDDLASVLRAGAGTDFTVTLVEGLGGYYTYAAAAARA